MSGIKKQLKISVSFVSFVVFLCQTNIFRWFYTPEYKKVDQHKTCSFKSYIELCDPKLSNGHVHSMMYELYAGCKLLTGIWNDGWRSLLLLLFCFEWFPSSTKRRVRKRKTLFLYSILLTIPNSCASFALTSSLIMLFNQEMKIQPFLNILSVFANVLLQVQGEQTKHPGLHACASSLFEISALHLSWRHWSTEMKAINWGSLKKK